MVAASDGRHSQHPQRYAYLRLLATPSFAFCLFFPPKDFGPRITSRNPREKAAFISAQNRIENFPCLRTLDPWFLHLGFLILNELPQLARGKFFHRFQSSSQTLKIAPEKSVLTSDGGISPPEIAPKSPPKSCRLLDSGHHRTPRESRAIRGATRAAQLSCGVLWQSPQTSCGVLKKTWQTFYFSARHHTTGRRAARESARIGDCAQTFCGVLCAVVLLAADLAAVILRRPAASSVACSVLCALSCCSVVWRALWRPVVALCSVLCGDVATAQHAQTLPQTLPQTEHAQILPQTFCGKVCVALCCALLCGVLCALSIGADVLRRPVACCGRLRLSTKQPAPELIGAGCALSCCAPRGYTIAKPLAMAPSRSARDAAFSRRPTTIPRLRPRGSSKRKSVVSPSMTR